jgi:hypothetical protein
MTTETEHTAVTSLTVLSSAAGCASRILAGQR